MKLTEEQLLVLQDTLHERITYKETYDEVYDHVLTALENTDDSVPIAQALDSIMQNEFGGIKGIRVVESRQNSAVAREMIKKQLRYFMDHFQPRFIAVTACIYAVVYFFVAELGFKPGHMFLYYSVMCLTTFCGVYRYYKDGYKFIKMDESIKQSSLMWIQMAPFVIFVGGFLIFEIVYYKFTHQRIFNNLNLPAGLISLFFTLYIIYCISCFRLYRDELDNTELK